MVDVNFITTDPATAAFQTGQRAAIERDRQEAQLQSQQLKNATDLAAAPSKLREVRANSDLAVTNADVAGRTADSKVQSAAADARRGTADADVAVGTVGSRIATSGANASTAGANARVAQGTVDSRIAQQDAAARTAGAGADVAVASVQPHIDQNIAAAKTATANSRLTGVNADVAERTADAKVTSENANARNNTARAIATEMEGFYKSLDQLNNGDVEGAKYIAQQYGQTIPQAVIDNASLRKEITDAANYAKTAYPNRPRDAQAYIQGFLKQRMERIAQNGGNTTPDPQAPYNVAGAPQPPEVATTTHSGQQSVFAQKQSAWLSVYPGDQQGALAYASGRRQMGDADMQKVAGQILNARYPKPTFMSAVEQQKRDALYQEILQGLRTNNATPAQPDMSGAQPAVPASPAPAPAPAPARPQAPAPGSPATPAGTPPGAGTRASPYQATTQAHLDWFKRSAPPGTVISANGQLYTK